MKLIALAKSIQPFIQKNITLEGIYKEILTNKSLPFASMLEPIDLIKLVFIAKKISEGEDPREIIPDLDTNLFLFSTVEFGDSNQQIDCEECMGDGSSECTWCDGAGEVDCDECDGSGEDEEGNSCDECQGGGKVECNNCDGEGTQECGYCDGQGYNDTEDYVPYDLGYYVSYDENLKNTLQRKLLRNDTEDPEFNSKKTFLLAVNEVGVKDGDSESIDDNYANTTHLLEINSEDIENDLIYGNGRIIPSGFYDNLDNFM
jgi:hypothetical protein